MGGKGSGRIPKIPKSKYVEAATEKLSKGDSFTLSEIGDKSVEPIEPTADDDLTRQMAEEAFANEMVTILVHPDNSEGALDVITPNVNGVNQPIVRGVQTKVKRKYVEALARARFTKYVQKRPDPSRPDYIVMDEVTVLSYPFAVIEDPNPRGREWLEQILAQK